MSDYTRGFLFGLLVALLILSFVVLAVLLPTKADAQAIHIEIDGGIAEDPVFTNIYTPWLTVNEPVIKVVWRLGPPVRPLWIKPETRSELPCSLYPVPATQIMWSLDHLNTTTTWVVVK